ncbi:uncharacterized protein LOC110461718 [Mizuhopecten yessoensis]|uniref:uncharacterized protein LOC110461718 n=1 Tax=Mizuhopecten yessoensis TaxID=6573 RepID=UPI000B45B25B|nr:uncharacterized protein LOC110461718 [Mizuhopecten yessoensis]
MKTCLILLGLVAAFVAVDCGVIAETKRQQQVSEVNMIDSMVYITGRLETLVENLAALKQAVEDFGGHQALEEYVSGAEHDFEQFFRNRAESEDNGIVPSDGPPAQYGGQWARSGGHPASTGGPPASTSGPPASTGGPTPATAASPSMRSLKKMLAELLKISKK